MSNINKINILQKKCIRIIYLKKYNDHTNPFFVDNKLLKLNDIIETSYVKLMFNFINNKLPPDLSNMFQYSFTVHNYNTRNVSN